MPSTLISNGLLFTGDANQKARICNILINEAGRIEKISDSSISVAEDVKQIDAAGLWIVPGFLDTHTHYDAEIIASPGLMESARHGVTSIILGSCSVSSLYNNPEDTADCFTRVEAIPRDIMLPLLEREKTWFSSKDWKDYINKLPLGINVASYVGHSDLRMHVMGIDRSLKEGEHASEQEIQTMVDLLEQALNEGFLGLSTMDNPWDKMDGKRYWSNKTPSYYSPWGERKRLFKLLRERDAILQGAPNLVTRVNAIRYMFLSAGWGRKPLKTTLIAMIDLIGDRYILPAVSLAGKIANKLGRADFRMQSPPGPFTVYYDGVDSVMFEEFPSGEAMRHLAKNIDQRNELIRDTEFRDNFKKEIKKQFAPKVWHKDLSRSVILACPEKELIGKDFYSIAQERNAHPVDTFLDLIIQYDKQIKWTTTIGNDREEKYPFLYNYPYNLISFSDAGAHLNNMAFYNFPLTMIKNVQDSIDAGQAIMSMEKCIWRLTKELADWFGLDRGYLSEGKVADIAILNPKAFDSISYDVQEAPIEAFDNYPRLVNRNPGAVVHVLVGGKTIIENNEFVKGYGKTTRYGQFLERIKNS